MLIFTEMELYKEKEVKLNDFGKIYLVSLKFCENKEKLS